VGGAAQPQPTALAVAASSGGWHRERQGSSPTQRTHPTAVALLPKPDTTSQQIKGKLYKKNNETTIARKQRREEEKLNKKML